MRPLAVKVLMHCILPLALGFFIYYFFRPDVAVVRCFTDRKPLIPLQEMNGLQKLLIYSGPDLCWSYSLASALFLWERGLQKRIRFFPVFVLLLLVMSELAQGIFIHHFTFDMADLGAAILAFLLSFIVIHYRHE